MELISAASLVDNRQLFSQLFDAEHGYVLHSLRRLGVAERDLEDLTHDVFVVVHRKLSDYDRTRPARPWLFAISARVASDYRRRARVRLEQVTALPESADLSLRADARLERKEQQALVIEALQSIEESRLALFVMVDLDEVAVPEAAEVLAIPLNTAYSRLRLARADFATAVARIQARRGAR